VNLLMVKEAKSRWREQKCVSAHWAHISADKFGKWFQFPECGKHTGKIHQTQVKLYPNNA
jgi:hypothetical protein